MKPLFLLFQIVALMNFCSGACIADQQNVLNPASNTHITSSGTCFFVDESGTAVTNNHVIEGNDSIEVIDSSGSRSVARVVKSSEILDVAVLSTGRTTPYYLSLASKSKLSLGQEVFTIGYPVTSLLGDSPKYSEGTISATSGMNNDDSWIQISTPIHPGNSGGPLVDQNGQVVGIVTATAAVEKFFSATGSLPQNINWAIKAEYARPLIPNVKSNSQSRNKEAVIAHTEKSICRVVIFEKNDNVVSTLDGFPTEKSRLSYAVGWDIGQDVLRRKSEIDIEQILTALLDSSSDFSPRVDTATMTRLLTKLQARVRDEQAGLSVRSGPESEKSDLSYAVGWDIGEDIKRRDGVEFDPILLGIRQAYYGLEPKVSPDEMQRLLAVLQEKVRKEQAAAFGSLAERNLAEGRAFLAKNLQNRGVKVLPSGIQYQVIEKGRGRKPRLKDTVVVHYRGSKIDGLVFDSSFARGVPEHFDLSRVLAAWREVIPLMRPGATWKVFSPPEYAFGARGNPPVGPNETLVFDILLIEID